MKLTAILTSHGQITIPREVCVRLGLKTGDRIEFVMEDGRTVVRPARGPGNPFEAYRGALPGFSSKREINRWLRDLREPQD